jgi:hypothetical protein
VPSNDFRKGFLDGWSSVRGSEPAPSIPACSVERGTDPYRAGFVRGVKEVRAKPPVSGTATTDVLMDKDHTDRRAPDVPPRASGARP